MKKILVMSLVMSLIACQSVEKEAPKKFVGNALPEWAASANIYEVNVRQYTPEGTFEAFSKHLDRLEQMDVDILWFMPIYPISETNRKGSLGSYYAISDYTAINPEYGTMEEFRALVKNIHDRGMKIVLDWVPNHTGWDHDWIKNQPDFYTKNKDGEITDPIDPNTGESWGWTDVADLNYDNKDLWQEMIDDMLFWIEDVDIDGFRCDVAQQVPDEFWDVAADSLFANKSLFMLAEAEHPPHRNSGNFHASYGWHMHHLMNQIAQGKENVDAIRKYLGEASKFEKGFHIHFTSNHDENSWNGTVFERMGDAHKVMAVLAATFDGMPLLYSGMEEPMRKRLAFFEKDTVPFDKFEYQEFYTQLNKLKHSNEALWNGEHGGDAELIFESDDILAFKREKNGNSFYGYLNLSDSIQTIDLSEEVNALNTVLSEDAELEGNALKLDAWGYLLKSNK